MKILTSIEFPAWLDETDPRYLYNPETRMAYKDVGFCPQQAAFCKGADGREFRITKKDEGLIKTLKCRCVMTAGEYAAYGPSVVYNTIPSSCTQFESWIKKRAEKKSIENVSLPKVDEFTTEMHWEMMQDEMSCEDFMCMAAFGAMRRGVPPEDALKKYGVSQADVDAWLEKQDPD